MTKVNPFHSRRAKSQSKNGKNGKEQLVGKESFITELMLSSIASITIMTIFIVLRLIFQDVFISMFQPYSLLVVTLIHTIIRRSRINNLIGIIVLHFLASAAFFVIAINIPVLQFGRSVSNEVFLGMMLLAMTCYSIGRRIRPTFTASDGEIIAFPVTVHVLGYIIMKFIFIVSSAFEINTRRTISLSPTLMIWKDYFPRYILVNALIVALIFVIMRQIAIFENQYYHTIKNTSESTKSLRRQNYKIVVILLIVFAVSLGIMAVFPYSIFSRIYDLIIIGARWLAWFISLLVNQDFGDTDIAATPERGLLIPEADDNILMVIIDYVVIVFVAVGLLILIVKGIKALIERIPRNTRVMRFDNGDSIVDIIEDLTPELKRVHSRRHNFGTGYERKIRKRFYNKTIRAMKDGLPVTKASTPGQIEAVLKDKGDKQISVLRQEYEKVRYSK